jgi:hypothetical protein
LAFGARHRLLGNYLLDAGSYVATPKR